MSKKRRMYIVVEYKGQSYYYGIKMSRDGNAIIHPILMGLDCVHDTDNVCIEWEIFRAPEKPGFALIMTTRSGCRYSLDGGTASIFLVKTAEHEPGFFGWKIRGNFLTCTYYDCDQDTFVTLSVNVQICSYFRGEDLVLVKSPMDQAVSVSLEEFPLFCSSLK